MGGAQFGATSNQVLRLSRAVDVVNVDGDCLCLENGGEHRDRFARASDTGIGCEQSACPRVGEQPRGASDAELACCAGFLESKSLPTYVAPDLSQLLALAKGVWALSAQEVRERVADRLRLKFAVLVVEEDVGVRDLSLPLEAVVQCVAKIRRQCSAGLAFTGNVQVLLYPDEATEVINELSRVCVGFKRVEGWNLGFSDCEHCSRGGYVVRWRRASDEEAGLVYVGEQAVPGDGVLDRAKRNIGTVTTEQVSEDPDDAALAGP